MKGRFITNGILSAIGMIGFIMFIAGVVSASKDATTTSINYDYWGNADFSSDLSSHAWTDLSYAVAGIIIYGLTAFASFVMGIVTLAMIGRANQRGLGIASGVIAILGGLFGVNAIISFIGAAKE